MNPHIQQIIIIFYSKHIIYQLLFKIYWPSSWFCRKYVIKAHQIRQWKCSDLMLMLFCRLGVGHQCCGK